MPREPLKGEGEQSNATDKFSPASSVYLYYPHSDFRDEGWLKYALLALGSVCRIRPAGYPQPESSASAAIREALPDFIVDVHPESADLDWVDGQFLHLIEKHSYILQSHFGLVTSEQWQREWLVNTPLGHARFPDKLSYIWTTRNAKMSIVLQQKLLASYLGQRVATQNHAWLGLHPDLAAFYLAALSYSMASRGNYVPVTDDPVAYEAFGDRTLERLGQTLIPRWGESLSCYQGTWRDAEVQSAFLDIAIRAVLRPRNIASIPVGELIQFRLDHQTELRALYDHLATLEADLKRIARIESPQAIEVHLSQLYRTETEPRLRELQHRLRARRIDSVLGALQLKFDPTAASGTAVGAAAIGALAATGHLSAAAMLDSTAVGAAISLLPYWRRRTKKHRNLAEHSPTSYLLALNKELARNLNL